MKAFVEYGLHNSELKEEFAHWIQELYAKMYYPKLWPIIAQH